MDLSPNLSPLPVTHIRPLKGWVALKLNEIWDYRELLYFLTWRDVKVRYKQTILGATWAILQPFITMVIFTLFFGRLAGLPSDDIPYPLFYFSALVPWIFFANGVSQAANSLVGSANMIKKVYFPRLVLPVSAVLAGGLDFLLAFVVLLGMMLFYGQIPSLKALWVIPLMLVALATALGVGFWSTALNVQFRDIRYALPFVIQIWMFASPVVIPASRLEEPWRTLYGLNPMTGVLEGFRWALLGSNQPPLTIALISTAVAIVLLISGAFYFRRMEKSFADVV